MKLISWLTEVSPRQPSYENSPNSIRHRFFSIQRCQKKYVNELFTHSHLETADAFIIKKMISEAQFHFTNTILSSSKSKVYVYDPDVNYFEDDFLDLVTQRHRRQAWHYVDISSAQMCSSIYLKNILSSRNAHLIPTCVPFREIRSYDIPEKLTIGWCGLSHKAEDLNLVADVLSDPNITAKYKLCIVSERKPNLNIPHEFVQYREGIFDEGLRNVDVAISPRYLDNTYNLGHSELKVTNWMSIGCPVVCSPQPSYLQCIDGKNGIVAYTAEEWKQALLSLADHAYRRQMGEAAFFTARTQYSETRIADLFEGMLDTII